MSIGIMKIRTKLTISLVCFGAAMFIISGLIINTNLQMERLNRQYELAKNIELKINEFNYLWNEYLLYQEEQNNNRLESKLTSAFTDLLHLKIDRPEQRIIVGQIKESQQRLMEIFQEVVSKIDNTIGNEAIPNESVFIRVSWSRMGIQTQRIILNASRLAQSIRDQENQIKHWADLLILTMIGALAAFFLVNYLLIYRRILKSLSNLQLGTRVIGSGNLDFAITVTKADEIGELAQAFNQMASNLKTITAQNQQMERELLKTEKLGSLGILAGGIAHDFNNILAAILSNVELALHKYIKNEDIRRYLENTVETSRKASDLTKQLLTFSKGGAPVKKDASLVDLIKDTVEFALHGSNIKAEFTISDDLWVASIDEGQISQVLNNLVINAKQAMPKGGFIYITAENLTVEKESHECDRFNPGPYVRITVEDQGLGISKEHLSKIFDPFFTTKKDGNGLGLSTSYSIVTRHNGYIEVDSKEGAGTTFFIYLPASIGAVLKTEAKKEIAAVDLGLKILLMDDEEKILQAVGEMLESYGHQVSLTADGAEMIAVYRRAFESGEPFDIVIMDLTIPGGMGGQEAIIHLRGFDPHIKAIVSSGYANDPIIADYERFGFCGMVSKPYKFDELNETLRRVVEGRK